MLQKVDFKLVLSTAVAVLLTWLLHEFSHWLTGRLLGYDMVMTLNSTYPLQGVYAENWHYILISAVGPIVTILQAIMIYAILRTKPSLYIYPFLVVCFYMRLLAGGMNVINLNDEGRVGALLGIGVYILPLIVAAFLFFLVYRTSRAQRYTLRFNAIITVLVIFFSSIVILADQFFKLRLL